MKYFLILIILLLLPIVSAQEYHIPLLAVKETEEGFEGSRADLTLEIQEGKGRIFLDTYPLTKLDTQMSTRFAKEISCTHTEKNCNNYDFIYTIKSNSIIVGGPSAGAATTLLTITALENLNLRDDIAITGTINSGGLIGPVGGVKEKIDAALDNGIKTVLIPHGENIEVNISNKTLTIIEYGEQEGIEIIEVVTIEEALAIATDKIIIKSNKTLERDETYLKTMKLVSEDLCKRTIELKNILIERKLNKEQQETFEQVVNLTKRKDAAMQNEKYYSAASYCFGANTKLSYLDMLTKNITIEDEIANTESKIKKAEEIIDNKNIKTITDLETYMIVKERLIEAEDNINQIEEQDNITDKIYYLSYAIERLNSAISWSAFFDTGEKEFIMNKKELQRSCIEKISEAEERYEYISLLLEMEFESTKKEIDLARLDLENNDYELCLFKASKAKANSDVILSMFGVEESNLYDFNEKKLEVIKQNIIEEQEKGNFPVVGYSYYEYANDLKDKDIYSSMLFAEYGLELSNLDMYFEEEKSNPKINIEINEALLLLIVFIAGILTGMKINSFYNKIK
tara:strand:- start:4175 stop:5887 length:1713 start_codon:yes stop_codon:yes gene_type:complete